MKLHPAVKYVSLYALILAATLVALALASCTSTKEVNKSETKQETKISEQDSLRIDYLKRDTAELRRQIREMEFFDATFQQCPEVDTAAFRKLFANDCPLARVDSVIRAISPKTSTFKKDKDGNIEITGQLKSVQYAKTRLEEELSTQRTTTAYVLDRLIQSSLQHVSQVKTVEKHKKTSFLSGFWLWLVIGLAIGFVIGGRARKLINEVDKIQPNNMKNLIIILMCGLLIAGCGKSPKPSNEISDTDVVKNGWDVVDKNTDPVPHLDTVYYTKPTWGQANLYASQRGDRVVWNWIGITLLVITVIWCIGVFTTLIKVFPEVTSMTKGVGTWVCLALTGMAFSWQAMNVKWRNKHEIKKTQYDYLMKRDGSIQSFWDSLNNGCHIVGGKYDCWDKDNRRVK